MVVLRRHEPLIFSVSDMTNSTNVNSGSMRDNLRVEGCYLGDIKVIERLWCQVILAKHISGSCCNISSFVSLLKTKGAFVVAVSVSTILL